MRGFGAFLTDNRLRGLCRTQNSRGQQARVTNRDTGTQGSSRPRATARDTGTQGSSRPRATARECRQCGTHTTSHWRRNYRGDNVCNACGLHSRRRWLQNSRYSAEIYEQEDTITDNDETNINISMNRKNADCSNSTHNYLNDEYSELTIDKTYDDDQKVYIEIETGVELVQQVSEDYGTHESSVGNNVKIKNVDSKVYIKGSQKSEEVTNESLKITNEDLQIKIEVDVNDENKEKIVENETGARVDLGIVKQEVDNEFHMQINKEQNKVDDLEIKKEVEDCNEVLNAETETRVEPEPKDDIQCDVDSNVLNRNLRTIARVNTFRMEKRKKCHRKASGDTYNCTKCLRVFESFDRYVSHFFLHDIKPNACPLCETSYESVKPLCNHIRNFHIAKSFVSLRLSNHEFDKMKTYKCLVCADIVIEQHCFNHWEKHFRFEASKQRLCVTSLADVDRKLENTKVIKKFKAAIYKQKDTITDNDKTNINISMNRKNADCSNSTHNYLNEIIENETGARVDLSIVKQEVDNGFHMQIKEEQNIVDHLEIKKEVEDCNEVLKGIFEVSKSESDFEADDDTNIGAIIAETETRVERKPKDDIQCDVDSNVLNRNLRTIARVNTFRMEKRKKCHR